jgi:hypothetical protein
MSGSIMQYCPNRREPFSMESCPPIFGKRYAANSRRIDPASNFSATGVRAENLMRPRRVKVRRATGSHGSLEMMPSANIARINCSSRSKSVRAISSVVHLRFVTDQ